MCETRKGNREEYTPRSLYLLLNGLQRYIRKTEEFNTCIWKDPVFTPLKNVCNSLFKRSHNSGVGADIKSMPVLTPDDEDKLWTSIAATAYMLFTIGLRVITASADRHVLTCFHVIPCLCDCYTIQ